MASFFPIKKVKQKYKDTEINNSYGSLRTNDASNEFSRQTPSPEEGPHRWLLDILEEGRITTVFQPIVDLRTSEVFAYEALSREIGPSRFSSVEAMFQTAQHHGLTAQLEALCRAQALFRARELELEAPMCLNVCPSVLQEMPKYGGDLPGLLDELYERRDNLILELTERLYIGDQEAFRKVVETYRKHGFRIAIDDLGSGYTGLQMLSELEPYMVKIDRFLIANLHRSSKKRLLLQSIVSFCNKINTYLVAEGVDSTEELQEVLSLGVDLGQGFHLARPHKEPAGCNPKALDRIAEFWSLKEKGREDPNTIGSLMEFVEPISEKEIVETLIERFKRDNSPSAIPVTRRNRPVGIVHKTKLFYLLGQRFSYSLSGKKPVSTLSEPVMTFEPGVRLEDVSREVLERDEEYIYDSIIVVRNGLYAGTVKIHKLYQRITEQKILLASQANPLTGLPGNNTISNEVSHRLFNNEIFAVIYADIDNFKPFNDHFGFAQGDCVIRFLGDLLNNTVQDWDYSGFVGHVGGDNFVAVCMARKIETLCKRIIRNFDDNIKSFHDPKTISRGYFEGIDCLGNPRRFAPLSLSLAVVSTKNRPLSSYGQLVSIASEVKNKSKEIPGSSYYVDMRKN
jgi:diguanylate cyclase (GGDEF)-like protein